jgi:hypothetical protein
MKWWASQQITLGILDNLDPSGLVKDRSFFSRIIYGNGLSLYFHSGLESISLMRPLSDRNQKFSGFPVTYPIYAKHIPQVAVGSLIKRSRKPNSRLNSHDPARPRYLL